jgi:hypothetical protein
MRNDVLETVGLTHLRVRRTRKLRLACCADEGVNLAKRPASAISLKVLDHRGFVPAEKPPTRVE